MTTTALVLAAILTTAAPREAPPPAHPLDLHRAVELALAHEPGVQAARSRHAAAEAEAAVAASARLPALSLSASATRHQEPMVITPIHGFTPEAFPEFDETLIRGGLRASYDLYQGGAREAQIDHSRNRALAAGARVGDREQALILTTAASYLEILGLAEVLDAHRARIEALEAEQQRVEQTLAVGRAAELDLRRIEAAIAAAEAERVRLDSALDLAGRRLARLIGLGPEETRAGLLQPVQLSSDRPFLRERLKAQAIARNPEVERARAELEATSAAVELAASGRRPRVRVQGDWMDFGSAELDFSGEWQVGLQLGLALYDGGATRERVAAAEAARAAASEDLRLVQQMIEEALDIALARAEETAAQARSLETAVRHLTEVSRIEKLRLDTGVGTQTDYLAAEAELLEARAGLVRARLGVIGAHLEVARVGGELAADWIATHLEESP